jgi:hypothetical protein
MKKASLRGRQTARLLVNTLSGCPLGYWRFAPLSQGMRADRHSRALETRLQTTNGYTKRSFARYCDAPMALVSSTAVCTPATSGGEFYPDGNAVVVG